MAVYRSMSLRMCALALAMVCVVILSTEVAQVHADSCDQNGIMNALTSCLSLTTIPSQGSSCCNSMNYVYSNIKPSATCICDTAKLGVNLGLPTSTIKKVISSCVGPFAVPGCL